MSETGIVNLDILEEKIKKAAELINRLREEKLALERENKELKEKLNSLYISNEELTREIEDLRLEKEKSQVSEETREEIKKRIEEMLAKLDELEL